MTFIVQFVGATISVQYLVYSYYLSYNIHVLSTLPTYKTFAQCASSIFMQQYYPSYNFDDPRVGKLV